MNLAVRKVRSFALNKKKHIAPKMLVASVTFDLTHIFTLVFTSLLYQKNGIEKTIVSTVYNGDKIQSGDNYLLPGLAEIT